LNVEFGRARSPFLDLDADNSSGARGTGYQAVVSDPAAGARISDFDARFANQLVLNLASLEIRLEAPADGADEDFTFDTTGTSIAGASQFVGNARVLTLTGSDTVAHYAQVLASVRYVNGADVVTPGTRTIEVVATGGTDFTALVSAAERIGNVALAMLEVEAAVAAVFAALPAVAVANFSNDNAMPEAAVDETAVLSPASAESVEPPAVAPLAMATAAPKKFAAPAPPTAVSSAVAAPSAPIVAHAGAETSTPAPPTVSAVEAAWWSWCERQTADPAPEEFPEVDIAGTADAVEPSGWLPVATSDFPLAGEVAAAEGGDLGQAIDFLYAEVADELVASSLL
jgi:hypothetical protein